MSIKITCRKATSDPITYRSEATVTVNGQTLTATYGGDENEGRQEVKDGALVSLRAEARKLGWSI